MDIAADRRLPYSFWQVQLSGWAAFYFMLLLAALPRLGEHHVLRYNTLACTILFALTSAVHPVCRRVAGAMRRIPRLTIAAGVLAICLPLGSFVSFAIALGTFGWRGLNRNNVQISWLQAGFALFLWCYLYFTLRENGAAAADSLEMFPRLEASGTAVEAAEIAREQRPATSSRFLARTGSRIEVVPEDAVLWFSAAGDYVEIHTAKSTHLVRKTMRNLESSLNPAIFVRIHRSRIVRWAEIAELTAVENGEYRVRLRDGSEHRSSRTYATKLTEWLRSGSGAQE